MEKYILETAFEVDAKKMNIQEAFKLDATDLFINEKTLTQILNAKGFKIARGAYCSHGLYGLMGFTSNQEEMEFSWTDHNEQERSLNEFHSHFETELEGLTSQLNGNQGF